MTKRLSHEIRRGLIIAKINSRKSRNGTRFSVAVVRLYRNGDQWKESTRFCRDDIPLVQLVLDEAHGWIFAQTDEDQ